MSNRKHFGNLGKIIPNFIIQSFRFCPTGKTENWDLKISEKYFRDFGDFRGFRVFDLASLLLVIAVMKAAGLLSFFVLYYFLTPSPH